MHGERHCRASGAITLRFVDVVPEVPYAIIPPHPIDMITLSRIAFVEVFCGAALY